MTKEIYCAFGTDVDSVAGWIGSYGGADSPSDIQRGVFATEVGVPRLLRLFKKYDLKTSFFIPGHSIETFPKEMEMIVAAGHEVGAHGYTHENPVAMTFQQEEDVLAKSVHLGLRFIPQFCVTFLLSADILLQQLSQYRLAIRFA